MQLSEIDNPQVHDLLQIDRDSLNSIAAPSWVKQTLSSCPWAAVRRAQASAGEIAVGVRGNTRSKRWGGFFKKRFISRIVRPTELLALERSSTRILRTPALRVLQEVIETWRGLTLPWGPTGSVGFELATGHQVTAEASDLDIAICAPDRISVEQARAVWESVTGLQTKVDIRVETPECGFSISGRQFPVFRSLRGGLPGGDAIP
jgi:phosphoribosyl-dephospho-CoA transferase